MKKLLLITFCLPIIFSCGDNSLAIGDTHQGGIIFYLDGDGGGLIAAPSDQSNSVEWGCKGTSISGADGLFNQKKTRAIGTGAQNTIDIEAGCTISGTAADICANLTLGGYSDWFLPSRDELKRMWYKLHIKGLGSFLNSHYWSSTEESSNRAWNVEFDNGYPFWFNKHNTYAVRAIRAF